MDEPTLRYLSAEERAKWYDANGLYDYPETAADLALPPPACGYGALVLTSWGDVMVKGKDVWPMAHALERYPHMCAVDFDSGLGGCRFVLKEIDPNRPLAEYSYCGSWKDLKQNGCRSTLRWTNEFGESSKNLRAAALIVANAHGVMSGHRSTQLALGCVSGDDDGDAKKAKTALQRVSNMFNLAATNTAQRKGMNQYNVPRIARAAATGSDVLRTTRVTLHLRTLLVLKAVSMQHLLQRRDDTLSKADCPRDSYNRAKMIKAIIDLLPDKMQRQCWAQIEQHWG